jgi:hypothetical protein
MKESGCVCVCVGVGGGVCGWMGDEEGGWMKESGCVCVGGGGRVDRRKEEEGSG